MSKKFNVGDRVRCSAYGDGDVVDWKNPLVPFGIIPGKCLIPLGGSYKKEIVNGSMVLVHFDSGLFDKGFGYSPFVALPVGVLELINSGEPKTQREERSDNYCSCSSPQIVSNIADGKKFFYCRSCKKENI